MSFMITLSTRPLFALGVIGTAFFVLGTCDRSQAFAVYTNRTAFNAATTGLTTLDFEGIAPAGEFVYTPSPPGYTSAGVTFTDNTPDPEFAGLQFIISKTYPGAEFMGSDFLSENGVGSAAHISFQNGVTAIGTDIASIAPTQTGLSSFVITVPTDSSEFDEYTLELNFHAVQFLGFTFTKPITSLLIAPLTEQEGPQLEGPQLDNFSFGQALPPPSPSPAPPPPTAVPTPALLPGLVGLGLSVWRKRKATSQSALNNDHTSLN